MTEFSYSVDAEDVMSSFYGVDAILYVEGEDDIPFWDAIFSNLSDLSLEIKEVGGCDELEPYITKICNGELTDLVAMDRDFRPFKE
uniref:DUF4435 domain-containing protein n=1 Tax=Vibrio campbellii TaxID=680 RepID=UPI000A82428C